MHNESFLFQLSLILKGVKCLLELDSVASEDCYILEKLLEKDTSLTHLIIGTVQQPTLIKRAIQKNFKLTYVRIRNLDNESINMCINRNINYSICKESLSIFTSLSGIPTELNDVVNKETLHQCYYAIPRNYTYIKY